MLSWLNEWVSSARADGADRLEPRGGRTPSENQGHGAQRHKDEEDDGVVQHGYLTPESYWRRFGDSLRPRSIDAANRHTRGLKLHRDELARRWASALRSQVVRRRTICHRLTGPTISNLALIRTGAPIFRTATSESLRRLGGSEHPREGAPLPSSPPRSTRTRESRAPTARARKCGRGGSE